MIRLKITKIIYVILVVVMICITAACDSGSGSVGAGGGGNPGDNESNGGNTASTSPGGEDVGGDSSPGWSDTGKDPGNSGAETDSSPGNAGPDSGKDTEPGGGSAPAGLTGSPEDILGKLMEDIAASGIQTPMCLPPMKVEADMSQNTIGLSEADFEKYVADSAYTMAAIGTFAHQIIIIQAKDAGAAGDVKRLVTGDNGYDAKKWICVFPEKAVAVESGAYVLIAAASAEAADAAVEAFKAAAGSIGEVNTFWEFAGEAGEGIESGAPGGLILG